MATEKINGFDKWEVENAAKDLIRSEEIRKKPKFYAAVKKELRRQTEAAQVALKKAGKN